MLDLLVAMARPIRPRSPFGRPSFALPVVAAVVGDPDAGAGAAGVEVIGVAVERPGSSDDFIWVVRVDDHIGDAGAVVDVEDLLPGLTAVHRAEYAALFVGEPHIAHRAGVDDVGVGGVDNHAVDMAGGLQAHVLPRFTAVEAFINTTAVVGRVARVALAGAYPDDVRVGVGNGYGADTEVLLVVKNRLETDASVAAHPYAATGRAYVEVVAVGGVNVNRRYPARHASGADVARGEGVPVFEVDLGAELGGAAGVKDA
jgi:hypothetical protein